MYILLNNNYYRTLLLLIISYFIYNIHFIENLPSIVFTKPFHRKFISLFIFIKSSSKLVIRIININCERYFHPFQPTPTINLERLLNTVFIKYLN